MEICNDIISRQVIAVAWAVNVTQVPAETLPLQSPTHSKDGTLHKFLFGLYVHKAWAEVTHSCSTCAERSVVVFFAPFRQCESECEDYSFITEQKLLQESLCAWIASDACRKQDLPQKDQTLNVFMSCFWLQLIKHSVTVFYIFLLNVNLSLCF